MISVLSYIRERLSSVSRQELLSITIQTCSLFLIVGVASRVEFWSRRVENNHRLIRRLTNVRK